MSAAELQLLMDRGVWLLARDWLPSHPKLKAAFERWGWTAGELVRHVHDTFEEIEQRADLLELIREHKRLSRIDHDEYQ